MPKEPFDMLQELVETLSDRLFEMAVTVGGHSTQLKITWVLVILMLTGIVGNFFFGIRPHEVIKP